MIARIPISSDLSKFTPKEKQYYKIKSSENFEYKGERELFVGEQLYKFSSTREP